MSDILQAKTITGEYSGFADSALRAVSSTFLTAHQDLSDYQTTAGMTAYQPAGNYLTAVPDSALSGFIPYSASGIELPNSNFKIDVSGQAYKGEEVASTIPITGVDYSNNYSFILKSTLINADTTTFYIKNPDCRYVLINYKQMDWNPIEEFRSDDPITSITINTSYLEQGTNYIMFAWSTTKTADKWNGPLADSAIELEYAGGTAIEYVPYLTTLPAGTMNESSFAYDIGNNITAYNGSAFAGGATYSAGANIDITDNVISGKDWSSNIIAATSGLQPSGDYYSASNPSGFITALPEEEEVEFEEIDLGDYLTAVPAGTMNESAFAYDASNNITAYNGSAFKAGDEFPQSATEAIETVTSSSAIWNETTDTVSSNSGAWGGSALPISAGPGVKVNLVDNTLVFSNDETVLWAGNHDVSATSSFALSESPANFEYVEIYGQGYPGHQTQLIAKWYTKEMTNDYLNCVAWGAGANAAALRFNQFLISGNNTTTINVLSARQFSLQGTAASTANSPSKLIKIIGINHL